MPELPDVEMARRLLEEALRGTTITRAQSADRLITKPSAPGGLARLLVGRTVRAIERRGKRLRLLLDDGGRLFSHLGMTGDWLVMRLDEPPARFERARIDVKRGKAERSLRYVDARRLGRLVASKEDIAAWRDLGPDPMSDGLDAQVLAHRLGRTRRPVKDALMDQSVLAGIGNILATEGLWHARIDPRSQSDRLSADDVRAIVAGLRKAIEKQLDSREKAHGGDPHDVFAAYGRAGEPCNRCGTQLSRIVLGGRTTTYCAHCQKRRGSRKK
ncbi:MAG TPA: DNA-formamidopyrimidine glycosylase family protein [Polyangiaceae bacterium]|jgi:formamidopyrimidine-DNA glycosylase|nr:DNA-formamidopyrimidine glycosylase family protein [Polyangiaceae bacterium]